MWIENVAPDYQAGCVNVTISEERQVIDSNGYANYMTRHRKLNVAMTKEVTGFVVIVKGQKIQLTTEQANIYDQLKVQFKGNSEVSFHENTKWIKPDYKEIIAEIKRQDGFTEQEDDRGFSPDHGRAAFDTQDMGWGKLHQQQESEPWMRSAPEASQDDEDAEQFVADEAPTEGWTDPTCL